MRVTNKSGRQIAIRTSKGTELLDHGKSGDFKIDQEVADRLSKVEGVKVSGAADEDEKAAGGKTSDDTKAARPATKT